MMLQDIITKLLNHRCAGSDVMINQLTDLFVETDKDFTYFTLVGCAE